MTNAVWLFGNLVGGVAIMFSGSLLLTETDVRELLPYNECVDLVEEAFRLHGQGRSLKPEMLQVDSELGEFHIKAGGMQYEKKYFCLKANGLFFHNSTRFGIPNVHGIVLLSDGENGYPLAIMNSRELMLKRTGAATVVAAKYLANKDSHTVTICGSGLQARTQLQALANCLPVKKAYIFGRNRTTVAALANDLSSELGIHIEPTEDLVAALSASQICVTCTPAHDFYIKQGDVPPGLFIAAVGADSPGKQEIDPKLLRTNKVVADLLQQCIHVGDLQHAIAEGMRPEKVYADLADVVAGQKPGRTSEEEIIIFDSTGTALQDVAAAVAVYKKASEQDEARYFDFFL